MTFQSILDVKVKFFNISFSSSDHLVVRLYLIIIWYPCFVTCYCFITTGVRRPSRCALYQLLFVHRHCYPDKATLQLPRLTKQGHANGGNVFSLLKSGDQWSRTIVALLLFGVFTQPFGISVKSHSFTIIAPTKKDAENISLTFILR